MSQYSAADQHKQKKIWERLIHLPYPKAYHPPYTEVPFGEICGVWANFALSELEAELEKRGGGLNSILSQKAKGKLKEKLLKQLSERSAPTLAALLHLAKMEGKLEGSSPKERYLYFIEKILPEPKYLTDFVFYFPPLARFISVQILLWIDQAIEFLERFQEDQKGKKIADLSLSLSDLHNGNRSVYRVDIKGGRSLIYKPKPLGLDKAYNGFLEQINGLGIEPKLKTYQIWDRGDYGWVEFLETMPCESEVQVKLYFERLGMLICIMFLLEGTDCHYENMICCGEDPVLIDLESLFHPTLKMFKEMPELIVWNHSVFRTGFLPSFGLAAQRRMDISPLSAEEEQELPQEVAQWDKVNTDEMQFIFVKKKIQVHIPRPKFQGKIVATTEYIGDLLGGFEKLYRLFMKEQKTILSFLEPLFAYPVRCIFRATALYFRILQRLTDPKLMRSEEEVDKTLEILMRFSAIKENPDLRLIADREKEAILYGDIPFFLSSPSDRHIYLGKEVVAENCFKFAAIEKVIEKIQSLDERDLKRQMEFMDHSLYFLRASDKNYTYASSHSETVSPPTDKQLIEAAEKIGEKIINSSIPLTDGTLAWISLELDPKLERYIFQPISSNFYSGYGGIALFFAALGKIGGKKKFIKHSEEILERILKPYKEDPEAVLLVSNIGGMSGIGGLIYTLSSVGRTLGKKRYFEEAANIAALVDQKKIEEDTSYDLILGSAGFLLSLLSLYENTLEPSVLEKAEAAGCYLLSKQEENGGWKTMYGKCLCGMSHGAAGIAYALYKLSIVSGKEFAKAAEKAMGYESALYNPAMGNWPDLRKEGGNAFSWCHGAPGIGLARIYSGSGHEKEIRLAIEATQKCLVGNIDHLCCGTFGRIAVLWEAGKIEMALKETAFLLKRFEEKGTFRLFHNLPESIQSPSFMQGLSGIGYFLLQLAAGKDLPRPLILA